MPSKNFKKLTEKIKGNCRANSIKKVLARLDSSERNKLLIEEDKDKFTLLHYACRFQNLNGINIVLGFMNEESMKKNMSSFNSLGWSPLHYVIRNSSEKLNQDEVIEIIKKFLKILAGECPHILSTPVKHTRSTPLHFAARFQSTSVVLYVIDILGAKAKELIQQSNKYGETPLHIIARNQSGRLSIEVIEPILQVLGNNARQEILRPNPHDNNWTPLHLAAFGWADNPKQHLAVIRLLVENSQCQLEDINKSRTHLNQTPKDIAAQWGRKNIINYFDDLENHTKPSSYLSSAIKNINSSCQKKISHDIVNSYRPGLEKNLNMIIVEEDLVSSYIKNKDEKQAKCFTLLADCLFDEVKQLVSRLDAKYKHDNQDIIPQFNTSKISSLLVKHRTKEKNEKLSATKKTYLKYIFDAAVLYQMALASYHEVNDEDGAVNISVKINAVYGFFEKIFNQHFKENNVKNFYGQSKCYKAQLKKIREKNTTLLEKQGNNAKEKCEEINNLTKKFLQKLIKDSASKLKKAPCHYLILGLGSLARGEATLYSDFEYAILLEREGDEEYFEVLAWLIQLYVIGLGETTPRMQDLSFLPQIMRVRGAKSIIKNGICADGQMKGARITPVGTRYFCDVEPDDHYYLIGSPCRLAKYVTNAKGKTFAHLSTVMRTVTPVYSPEKTNALFNQYLSALKNHIKNDQARQNKALAILNKIIDEFQVNFGRLTLQQGRVYSLKYNMYRLPSMFVEQFSFFYGITANTVWEKLEQLYKNKHISQASLKNLSALMSSVALLRANVYTHYGEQCNEILPEALSNLSHVGFSLSETEIDSIYKAQFYLEYYAYDFICSKGEKNFFKAEGAFCGGDDSIKMDMEFSLGNYQNVIKAANTLISQIKQSNNDIKQLTFCYHKLGASYLELGDVELSKKAYEDALLLDKNNPVVYSKLAHIYELMGNSSESRSCHEDALSCIKKNNEKKEYVDCKGPVMNGYALALYRYGYYDEAIKLFKQAIEQVKSKKRRYINYSNNLALVYLEKFKFEKAKKILEELEASTKTELGDASIDMAIIQQHLGHLFYKYSDYKKADFYYMSVLSILSKYHTRDALEITQRCLSEQALVDCRLHNKPSILIRHGAKLAYDYAEQLYRDFDALTLSRASSNYANVLRELKVYEESINYAKKSIDLLKNNNVNGTVKFLYNMAIFHNELALSYIEQINETGDYRNKKELINLKPKIEKYMNQLVDFYKKTNSREIGLCIATLKSLLVSVDLILNCNTVEASKKNIPIYDEILELLNKVYHNRPTFDLDITYLNKARTYNYLLRNNQYDNNKQEVFRLITSSCESALKVFTDIFGPIKCHDISIAYCYALLADSALILYCGFYCREYNKEQIRCIINFYNNQALNSLKEIARSDINDKLLSQELAKCYARRIQLRRRINAVYKNIKIDHKQSDIFEGVKEFLNTYKNTKNTQQDCKIINFSRKDAQSCLKQLNEVKGRLENISQQRQGHRASASTGQKNRRKPKTKLIHRNNKKKNARAFSLFKKKHKLKTRDTNSDKNSKISDHQLLKAESSYNVN